jgi:thymidine kinase
MTDINTDIDAGCVGVSSPFARRPGQIHLHCGCMFSGKTTAMWDYMQKARLAGRSVLVIKYLGDNRFTDEPIIRTHSGLTFGNEDATEHKGRQIVVMADRLMEVHIPDDVTDIGVDEGQFFPDLSDVCISWARVGGTDVHISALLADKDQRHFGVVNGDTYVPGPVEKILPMCWIHQHIAVCRMCGSDAIHTIKIGGSSELVEIGGIELYNPVCDVCLNKFESTLTT